MATALRTISTADAAATIYKVDDEPGYYFCCDTCGACSWHEPDEQTILALAWDHVFNLNHVRYHD